VDFAMNRGFATLHTNGLRWFVGLFGHTNSTNFEAVFYGRELFPFTVFLHFLDPTFGELQTPATEPH
jgi:hypothetical protein